MNKELLAQKIADFDANNSIATGQGIFGLPFDVEESEIILYPIPWDVTTSYRDGTSEGPAQIFQASSQLDLYDPSFGEIWKRGIHLFQGHYEEIAKLNSNLRPIAAEYLRHLEQGNPVNKEIERHINQACGELKNMVKEVCDNLLNQGHKVGIIGGEHSIAQGLMEVLYEKNNNLSILQIDAHADLRPSYLGMENSHASVMYNTLQSCPEARLTLVGLRDYSKEEMDRISSDERINCFYDQEVKKEAFEGKGWNHHVDSILSNLGDRVYLSLDVDGLSPEFCPHTGTPVPGGLSFDQINYLISRLKDAGKSIIGFDLSETGNNQLDGIFSARLLYKLCGLLS